jgi:hypothetical protein
MSFMSISAKENLRSGPYNEILMVKTREDRISKWVILEDGKFNIVWDSISNITFCFSFILMPLVIMSNIHLLDSVRIPELIIDVILAIDI